MTMGKPELDNDPQLGNDVVPVDQLIRTRRKKRKKRSHTKGFRGFVRRWWPLFMGLVTMAVVVLAFLLARNYAESHIANDLPPQPTDY